MRKEASLVRGILYFIKFYNDKFADSRISSAETFWIKNKKKNSIIA
jgi:hypothetical protein